MSRSIEKIIKLYFQNAAVSFVVFGLGIYLLRVKQFNTASISHNYVIILIISM